VYVLDRVLQPVGARCHIRRIDSNLIFVVCSVLFCSSLDFEVQNFRCERLICRHWTVHLLQQKNVLCSRPCALQSNAYNKLVLVVMTHTSEVFVHLCLFVSIVFAAFLQVRECGRGFCHSKGKQSAMCSNPTVLPAISRARRANVARDRDCSRVCDQ
jgi:hypothetical protein